MDDPLTPRRMRLPVNLALACALEDTGNPFVAAQALGESGLSQMSRQMFALLMYDMVAPLLEMGAVYVDNDGHKRIDRQAVIDFGIVACGMSRNEVLYERSLHELALYHRRLAPSCGMSMAALDADFLVEMQALFPDAIKDEH